jgi:hypothetical protein
MPDEGLNGEAPRTRRERNAAHGMEHLSPDPIELSPPAQEYWQWYFEKPGGLSRCVRRVRGGVCEPVPPSELMAWIAENRRIVHAWERAILRAMDDAYCDAVNQELTEFRERSSAPTTPPGASKKGG